LVWWRLVQTLTEQELLENRKGKFFGQANLVLIGQRHLRDGGSFTRINVVSTSSVGDPTARRTN
jgi:hypothetical protein